MEKIDKNIEQYKEEYLTFLKEQLKDKCNSDMCCEIYWDYRDEISPSTLREVVDEYKEKGFENPKDYLVEKLWELNSDYDDSMFDEIKNEIENCDNEHIVAYFEQFGDLREDASSIGYNGIDVNVDEILRKSEFCINMMFATNAERNYDMGSIVSSFGSYKNPDFEYLETCPDALDNALTYFIHQQGHSVKEVYDCLLKNPRGWDSGSDLSFAQAIVNDIVNNSSEAMSEVTALIRINGNHFLKLVEEIEKEEKYLTFDKNTDIGIFNEWSGTGGLLEFKLDKPFVVPTSMVREVQIEGAENDNYSVNSVYGLIGSCWKDTLGYTYTAPELYQEDLTETINYAKCLAVPYELKTTGQDHDFIATVYNNTDSILKFNFEDYSEIDSFEVAPKDWVGLLDDDDGRETLHALERELFDLEFVEARPQLDEVLADAQDRAVDIKGVHTGKDSYELD